jgi:AcrR family transcriptional regulator
MPRAGLTTTSVVSAGAALADEVGFENLTMGLLADRVGVRTPSLYKHVESLDALGRAISVAARRELKDVLVRATVGQAGPAAVRAYSDAFRRWVRRHPGRYASCVRAPEADDEDGLRVSDEHLEVIYDVLAGFDLPGRRAVDAARWLRSALHGFVSLENAGGFGLSRDVDRSFRFIVDSLIAGLRAGPGEGHAVRPVDGDEHHGSLREYHRPSADVVAGDG